MPEALVIPGLVAIDPHRWDGCGQAEVIRGPLAGKAALPDLEDWKVGLWLLPREVAVRRGLRVPDARAELAAYPRLRARMAEAALVVVDEAHLGAGEAGDMRIFLAYHRVSAGGGLEVHGPDGVRGFSADDVSLFAQLRGDADDDDDVDHPAIASVYDRVLRALTGGRLSLYDVGLALWAENLSPSVYASFEAELAEIEAMAAERRPLAESLVAALAAAEGDEVPLPGGYQARRQREPAFALRSGGGVTVTNGPIRVPAVDRWFVADVQAFAPPGRQARRQQAFAQVHRANKQQVVRAIVGLALAVLGLLVLIVLSFVGGG